MEKLNHIARCKVNRRFQHCKEISPIKREEKLQDLAIPRAPSAIKGENEEEEPAAEVQKKKRSTISRGEFDKFNYWKTLFEAFEGNVRHVRCATSPTGVDLDIGNQHRSQQGRWTASV